jgi:mitogen-activated protein kinase 1/3
MMKNDFIQEWKIILDDYEPIKVLGTGSYGHVIEAEHKKTNKKVAIKRVTCLFEDLIDTKRILREITLLRFMKNQFVVELLDIIYENENPYFDTIFLIFECAPSDLKKIIKSALYLNMLDVKLLVYHILCGLKYIHSCAVLHRDLKPGNILLDDNYQIKICDFGLARSVMKADEEEEIEEVKVPDTKKTINKDKLLENNTLNKYLGKGKGKTDENSLEKKNSEKIKKSDKTEKNTENSDNSISTESTTKTSVTKPKMLTRKNPNKPTQMLSVHVVTRWYRAPELILIEKDYSSAIDLWSVGCIFAELMMMIKENAATFVDRTPLFPGKFCFPLSPPDRSNSIKVNENGFPVDKSDQLNVIFDVIGTPTDEDMEFITDQNGILYLKSIKIRPKRDLKKKFPGSSDDSLDLLNKLLQFNPRKRVNVNEALEHPLFAEVRSPTKEIEADFNLEFEFEKDENLNMEKLRTLFIQVIKSYKSEINI